MLKKTKLSIASAISLLIPGLAFAQRQTLADIIDLLIYYLNIFLVLLMAVAVVFFVFNVVRYFILPNNNRGEAGLYVMYSVIGFFVILSFWGIVGILQNTFGLGNDRNRPDSWVSFSNLFPRGSSTYSPRTNDNFDGFDPSGIGD